MPNPKIITILHIWPELFGSSLVHTNGFKLVKYPYTDTGLTKLHAPAYTK